VEGEGGGEKVRATGRGWEYRPLHRFDYCSRKDLGRPKTPDEDHETWKKYDHMDFQKRPDEIISGSFFLMCVTVDTKLCHLQCEGITWYR
jgi:hypothetical protein